MVELEEVDPAHGDVVIEALAGASVVEHAFAVLADAGLLEGAADSGFVGAVEDGRGDSPAQSLGCIAQMDLQDLSDIHTGRDAQGVQDYVQRSAVRQIRHIFTGKDAGHDALVAVAAGHLVAHADLALLGDVDADDLVDAGGHLVAIFTGEALHIHNNAALAVGDLQGCIPDLSRLFAEDGAQQALLRGEIGLSLGGDLAHQDVARADFRADGDDAALVQILQRVVAHAGDVPGDLLGAQLGVAGVALVFLNMDGGKNVLHDQALGNQDGVLVVVAFPGHKSDQDVLAQRNFALAGGGAVGQHVALLHPLAQRHDGPLIYAGALV